MLRSALLGGAGLLLGSLAACEARPPHGDRAGPAGSRRATALTLPDDVEGLRRSLLFSDPDVFEARIAAAGPEIELTGPADYRPPVRSPRALALWGPDAFGDFVLDCELRQTGREYGHRDLCLYFGHGGPARFYYVHLASRADQHAHNIFEVDAEPRRAIATTTSEGIDWGSTDSWHHVRLERRGDAVRVYFDDMATPIMVAEGVATRPGRIGFGSFDDSGVIRNVRVRGQRVEPPVSPAFVE